MDKAAPNDASIIARVPSAMKAEILTVATRKGHDLSAEVREALVTHLLCERALKTDANRGHP